MIDVEQRTFFDHAGEKVTLTSMEFDLLYTPIPHPRRALSRDQLLDLAHHARSARLIGRCPYHEIGQLYTEESNMAELLDSGQAGAGIDVTPAMIEAGKLALIAWSEGSSYFGKGAEAVFSAMIAVAEPFEPFRGIKDCIG